MTASHIVRSISVGDVQDCLLSDVDAARVHVMFPREKCFMSDCQGFQITETVGDDWSTVWVPQSRLVEVAERIERISRSGTRPTLVHCRQGIERSPLAVAFWMWWCHGGDRDFEAAYDFVLSRRPIAQRRSHWIRWNE